MARKTALARQSADPPQAPQDLQHYSAGNLERVFDAFEKDLGGRQALLDAILAAPQDGPHGDLLKVLADPTSDGMKLGEILRRSNVSFGAILEMIKQSGFARAYVKTIGIISTHVPAVAQDVMTRAAPHYIPCYPCSGTGRVGAKKPNDPPLRCEECQGAGQRYTLPDLDRQKVALDLARLLPKAGPLVAVQTAPRPMGTGTVEAMTDLIRATDDLLKTAAPRPPSSRLVAHEGDPSDPARDSRDIAEGTVVAFPSDGTGGDPTPA